MAISPPIWIVDDDPEIRQVFSLALNHSGYLAVTFSNGSDALAQLDKQPPELIILDVDMPGMDGFGVLTELRQRGCVQPILMITGSNDVDSRVKGLELGADDYIGKPCLAPELIARVRALIRRTNPPWAGGFSTVARVRYRDVQIDLEGKTATKGEAPLRLTRTDYALLKLLHDNLGKPVSRETILREVWESQTGNSHALDTHLWRLRKKIGDVDEGEHWIKNSPGIGYMMTRTS